MTQGLLRPPGGKEKPGSRQLPPAQQAGPQLTLGFVFPFSVPRGVQEGLSLRKQRHLGA